MKRPRKTGTPRHKHNTSTKRKNQAVQKIRPFTLKVLRGMGMIV